MKSVMFFLMLTAMFLCSDLVKAQDYKSSIGARAGYPSSHRTLIGFNFKHFMSERAAVEGIVSWMWRGRELRFTALYQHHFDIPVEGLRWYLGGGGYAGIASRRYHPHYNWYYYEDNYVIPIFGITFVGGVEYKFRDLPIALALDHMPSIGFNRLSRDGFDPAGLGNGGVSFRYTFSE